MAPLYYRLDGHRVVACADVLEWARWFETATEERTVAQTTVGSLMVSTVFIGLDSNPLGPVPVLFETKVFPAGRYGERYATWEDAERGHQRIVDTIRAELS